MTAPVEVDPPDTWLYTEPLHLRDGVEFITGAGGRSMLVVPGGKFLNISTSGLALVRRLAPGPTGRALMASLTAEHPDQSDQIARVVPDFLTGLRQAGVLTLDPAPATTKERFNRLGKLDPVKRFPLVRNPNRLAAPVAVALARIPAALLSAVLLAVGVAAIPLIVLAVTTRPLGVPALGTAAAALALLAVEIVLHECAHAIGMAYNQVPARSAGVGLLFYVLPIAYVDRTESYRHDGRFGRTLISLAGPLVDLALAAVTATITLTQSGPVAVLCHTLLLLQVLSLLANFNPLFPSDGYHALEAALGSINMRGRALTYVLHRLSRTPLPLYLQAVPRRTRIGYLGYAVVSLLYTAAVLLAVLANVLALLARLW